MKDYIYSLYNYFSAKPKLLWSVFGLIVLLLLLALSSVKFEEDISSFLPEKKSNQRVNHAYKQIGSANKIMVIISAVDSARDGRESFLMEVADQFVEELKQWDTLGLTQEIFYKTDGAEITEIPQFIAKNIPLYLDEKDYQRIDSILATDGAISSIMQNNVALLQSPGSGMIKELMVIDPLYISSSALMKLRGVEATSGYHLKAGYIFDKAGESVLITLTSDRPSSETLLNKEWIKLIEESALSIENNHNQEVSIESIGSAIISLENADQIKRDTLLSVVIAVGLILIILFLFYRSFRSLLLISLSIVFGVLFSLAFLAIFKDSISIISVGVGSIIVGIAVNYPLHFLAHYKENGNAGQTIKDITAPLVIGNVTTVGAFLSLLFISSDAMKDMGLFSALLLIGTILFVLLILPHFIKDKPSYTKKGNNLFFGSLAKMDLEEKPILIFLLILVTIPLFYFSGKTEFETNMHKINFMTESQRINLQKLISETESGYPKVYCVSEGNTMEDALQQFEMVFPIIDSLQNSGEIVKNSGLSIFIPSKQLQAQKIEQWNAFWRDRKEPFLSKLSQAQIACGFQSDAFAHFDSTLHKEFQVQELEYFQPLLQSFGKNYLLLNGEKPALFSILECEPDKVDNVVTLLDSLREN
ncbi:MAG: MMPL family transporter, partial [Paludibacteraceae bacterium]|nr:MMPL family transporter [Paludibacteraceae bacterium]